MTEPGISKDTLMALEAMRYKVSKDDAGNYTHTVLGRVNTVGLAKGYAVGAADPRGPKSAAIGD